MKIKVFDIRLEKEHLQNDQDALNNFLENVTVKKTATQLISASSDYWSVLVYYVNEKPVTVTKATTTEKIVFAADSNLSDDERKTYEALKQWRFDTAGQLKLPSYLISSNVQLVSIAKTRPRSPEDLIKIKGFGAHKAAKYGSDIIALLNSVG
ncbi:MAG: HRDC domain-containing protein [Bacteroidia bacterium]